MDKFRNNTPFDEDLLKSAKKIDDASDVLTKVARDFKSNKISQYQKSSVPILDNSLDETEYDESKTVVIDLKTRLRSYASNSKVEVSEDMDEGYKKLIDRLDQDVRDQNKHFDNVLSEIKKDASEREKRIEDSIKQTLDIIKDQISNNEKYHKERIDELKESFNEVKQNMRDNTNQVRALSITTVVALITTIVAIVGIAVTVYITVKPSPAPSPSNSHASSSSISKTATAQ